jgi:aspartyl-tRNA(Asn)/glutamyl-tRNA(Gln) amidotransferase subunit A
MTTLDELPLTELAHQIARREISSVEVTSAYLERIQRFDQTLRAFITVDAERRCLADYQRRAGRARPLNAGPT